MHLSAFEYPNLAFSPTVPEDEYNARSFAYDLRYFDRSANSDTEPFDWYEQYRGSDIQLLLRKRLRKAKDDIILNLGCGNSRLAEDLFENGFEK